MSIPVQTIIDHVSDSIAGALSHRSWLHADALNIGGFSTGEQQRLICNLVHLPTEEPAYCEVGLYKGKTFCAAMNNSTTLHLYGYEDASQPFGDDNVIGELKANIEKFKGDAKSVTLFDGDFFKMDLKQIKHKCQVFYYDGNHAYSFQKDALPYMLDALDDTFVYLVDDFSWPVVASGCRDSLQLLKDKVKIEREWILSDGVPDGKLWHNSVAIFVLSKVRV